MKRAAGGGIAAGRAEVNGLMRADEQRDANERQPAAGANFDNAFCEMLMKCDSRI